MNKHLKHQRLALLTSVGVLWTHSAWATAYPVGAGTTSSVQISAGGTDSIVVDPLGVLSVNDTAIKWNSASTDLEITNNGTIWSTATDGRAINAGGSTTAPRVLTLLNGTTGLITSQNDAIRINTDITQGSVTLYNSGTIQSTVDGQAIDFDAVNSTADGAIKIYNLAGGVIQSTDADAMRPGQGAFVDNAGLIYAGAVANTSSDGIDLQAHSSTIINEVGGTISGARHGITTDNDVIVTNYGTITGRNGSGVGSDGNATVYNYGTIAGDYNGSGTGDGDGVDIDGQAYVYNNGTIKATGAAGLDSGGNANSSEGLALNYGTVYNDTSGVISSVGVGINFCCSAQTSDVTNKGLIHGDNYGIGLFSGGSLLNYGSITGGNQAILTDGVASIVNYGSLWGSAYAIDVLTVFHSTSSLAIDNYGSIGGDYGALLIVENASVSLTMEKGSSLEGVITLAGKLKVVSNTDSTFASEISGAGSLTKEGSGQLTLSGLNYYTGGTTINAGTLALTGNGTLGDISGSTSVNTGGTLDLGGTVQTQNGGVTLAGGTIRNGSLSSAGTFALQGGTISAALTGTGTVVQTSGITSLTGANTYTGGTQVLGGVLQVTSTSLQGAVLNNATVEFAQVSDGTYGGSITGTGAVVKSGAGTLTLTSAGAYTGGTTITAGTLALSGNGTLGATSNALTLTGGTLDLRGAIQTQNGGLTITGGLLQNGTLSSSGVFNLQGGTITAALSGTGSVVQTSGQTTLTGANSYTGGTTITAGTLRGSTTSLYGPILDNGTLEFAQGSDGTYSGSITGTGSLVKSGSGSLSLTGANVISGSTTASAGRLAINGTLSTGGLTVGRGSTLGGTGTVSMTGAGIVTVASGGTLAPGNSPGTLTVNGNLTLASGSTTALDIDGATWSAAGGAGSYDRLVVNGTVTLGGTLIPTLRGISGSTTNSYTPTLGSRYTVITANTVSGSYAAITQPTAGLAANTRLDALYGATTVQLVVTPASFTTLGAASGWNTNTIAVAGALDSMRSSSTSATLFSNLYGLDAGGYGLSLSQLSGQIYADTLQGFASASSAALSVVRDQAAHGRSANTRSQNGAEVWTRFIHTHENPGDSSRGNAYAANTDGFVAGITLFTRPDVHFGAAGGYTHTTVNSGLGASAKGSGMVAYVYGNYAPSPVFDLTAVGGFARTVFNTSRAISTTGNTVSANGKGATSALQLAIDARYRALQTGDLSLYATAGFEAGIDTSPMIKETATNSAFALTLPRSTWNTVDARLGGQLVQRFKQVSLSAYGNWRVQVGDAPTASRQASLTGTSWTIQSTGMSASGIDYGAALNAHLRECLSVQVGYNGSDRGKGYRNDRLSAGVSFAF